MFTCIPHVLAVDSITEALENDNELIEITPLQMNEIMKLVKLCLESTTFQWRDNIFQQIIGTPIGSPISVIIAELTMQCFENKALLNPPFEPLFWNYMWTTSLQPFQLQNWEISHIT